jgi:hypothetical protein
MKLDLTMDEILEDLCWPGLAPGKWNVPDQSPNSARNSPDALHFDHMNTEVWRACPVGTARAR